MNTFLRSLSTTEQIGALFLVVFGVLALITLWAVVRGLREARHDSPEAQARKMAARQLRALLQTSWAMATVFWVSWAQGDDHLALHAGDAPLAFDGASAPHCSLLAGPTQDLNLMLRDGLGDGVGGGMVRAHPGQHWHACATQGGVYSLVPGMLFDDDAGQQWPVPAETLVWFNAVPVRLRLEVPDTVLAFWLAVDLPAGEAA